jgi:iron complex outermembrane receptor protein
MLVAVVTSVPVPAFTSQSAIENLLFMDIPQVVTASKHEESIDEAPNAMYVVTAEQIKERGYNTLSDVLKTIPSMNVFYKDITSVAQVRGIAPNDNEKITIMLDGHPLISANEGCLEGPINLDNVARIEIIVGPGSVLYGADTLCAIINLITKTPEKSSEVVVHVGDQGKQALSLVTGEKVSDKINYMLSATVNKDDGTNIRPSQSLIANDNANYQGNVLTIYPSYMITGRMQVNNWTILANSINSDTANGGNPDSDPSEAPGHRQEYMDSLVFENNHSLDSLFEGLTGNFKIIYDSKRTVRTSYGGNPSDPNNNVNTLDWNEKDYGLEYSVQYKKESNFFQAGLQYKDRQVRDNYFLLDNPGYPDLSKTPAGATYAYPMIADADIPTIGAYLSDEYKINSKLTLTGACRFDQDNIVQDVNKIWPSPRVALVYKPEDKFITKLIYNTATHMPDTAASTYNLIWGDQKNPYFNWAVLPNATVPEVLSTLELDNILYAAKSRISLNLYTQKLDNYISWYNPATNVGNFSGGGVEFEIQTKFSKQFNLIANASYQKTDFTPYTSYNGNTPSSLGAGGITISVANPQGDCIAVPKVMANLIGEYNVTDNVCISPAVQYFTQQPGYFNYTTGGEWEYVNNQFYANLGICWKNVIKNTLDLTLAGKNIFNNRDLVAAPFRLSVEAPRGSTIDLTMYYKF